MEKLLMFLLAIAVQPLLAIFFLFIWDATIYIVEETNHSWKALKRSAREAVWEMEWKLKLMKGR